jgi:thiol-disulfide isomerase/thioredoxin
MYKNVFKLQNIIMNPYLKIIALTASVFFIGCFQNTNSQLVAKVPSKMDSISVSVIFAEKGKIKITYLDEKYTNRFILFANSKQGDTMITKKIYAINTTVLNWSEFSLNKLFELNYIGIPGDSLVFVYKHEKLMLTDSTSKANAINVIFGRRNILESDKPYVGQSIDKLIDSIEKRHLSYQSKIDELVSKNRWDSSIIYTLDSYNLLGKFIDVFKIDYLKVSKGNINKSKLRDYYIQFLKNKILLEKFNCLNQKQLLFYTTQYASYIAGEKNFDNFFENITNIDTSLFKKKYVDGFIYDILENSENIKSVRDKRAKVNFLHYILKDTSFFFKSINNINAKLTPDVLSEFLEDITKNKIQFSELIKTSKKLVVIDFWASWCVPCISEIPWLKKNQKLFSGDVEFISISIDENDLKWVSSCNRFALISNSYRTSMGKISPLANFLNLQSIPRVILLNNKGEVLENMFYRPSDKRFTLNLSEYLTSTK